jgi:pyruvate formate lyase activating enzyme
MKFKGGSSPTGDRIHASASKGVTSLGREAWLYVAFPDGRVRCHLCSHQCTIADDKLGVCKVRKNVAGRLFSLSYGQIISQQVDPIEKKPLYHYYPGTGSYSIATAGCNFGCRWCQNWHISQAEVVQPLPPTQWITPEDVVADALSTRCKSIAYTYTEPTIFFEFSYDTARLAHEAGLANLYVTNGYMSEEMLNVFQGYLDGANVDLKAFRDETYKKLVGARLQPVLDRLIKLKEMGIWVEVTTLLVTGINDDPAEIRDIAGFIAGQLGSDTPWHISRFFPTYRMTDRASTPVATLRRAREIGGEEGLKYVYVGNVHDTSGNDTLCPSCGQVLIRRYGYSIRVEGLVRGSCMSCGESIAGVWMD